MQVNQASGPGNSQISHKQLSNTAYADRARNKLDPEFVARSTSQTISSQIKILPEKKKSNLKEWGRSKKLRVFDRSRLSNDSS